MPQEIVGSRPQQGAKRIVEQMELFGSASVARGSIKPRVHLRVTLQMGVLISIYI
jgi:hypothetical protein